MVRVKSMDGLVCPVCSEGKLSRTSIERAVSHAGIHGVVQHFFSACDSCESEIIDQEASVLNTRAVADFRKQAEGLLTGREIREFRLKYDLTQDVAAALFGGGKVAFSRYERDEVSQSVPMDNLIRLCINNPYNIELLAQIRSIKLAASSLLRIQAEYWQDWMEIAGHVKQTLNKELTAKLTHSAYTGANDASEIVIEWQEANNNCLAEAA